jgi:hypothetical protein
MAHADTIKFPGEGITGTGVGLKMLIFLLFHSHTIACPPREFGLCHPLYAF